jgi:protein-tyrosine phosphatase
MPLDAQLWHGSRRSRHMRAELYRVEHGGPGILSVMARPRGGDWLADEIGTWRDAGVDLVVCLLTPAELAELDLEGEATECQQQRMVFRALPIADRGIPSQPAAAEQVIDEVVHALTAGKHVAIHCRAGIGRSAMIAAAGLVALGETPARAFAAVEAARGLPVPDTPEQRRWVERYAALPRLGRIPLPHADDTP